MGRGAHPDRRSTGRLQRLTRVDACPPKKNPKPVTAVRQPDRSDAIAGKPAPTRVLPTDTIQTPTPKPVTAVRQPDRSEDIAGKPAPTRGLLTDTIQTPTPKPVGASLLAIRRHRGPKARQQLRHRSQASSHKGSASQHNPNPNPKTCRIELARDPLTKQLPQGALPGPQD